MDDKETEGKHREGDNGTDKKDVELVKCRVMTSETGEETVKRQMWQGRKKKTGKIKISRSRHSDLRRHAADKSATNI